jgi:hypothetical protein
MHRLGDLSHVCVLGPGIAYGRLHCDYSSTDGEKTRQTEISLT